MLLRAHTRVSHAKRTVSGFIRAVFSGLRPAGEVGQVSYKLYSAAFGLQGRYVRFQTSCIQRPSACKGGRSGFIRAAFSGLRHAGEVGQVSHELYSAAFGLQGR